MVIGISCRHVSQDDAMAHAFDYGRMNDISARDQRRSGQWFFSKGQDGYAPLRPWIAPAGEVADPHELRIGLRVNRATKQDSSTRCTRFRIPELIADIARGVTLEPGDVIAMGSPSGVGAGRTRPEFLQPGDDVEIEIEIESIGVLRNPVIDATSSAA